ncbi:cobalamin-5'-phosphate synthase [Breznakibacter xylanolyticus]|uniref:Adenosylcobinamide-GDP ribazoletransferase n=1 Tax=Breznakibacter xylanolyticus TaxID=990 RepID=A0A2W7N0C8_9BACT|nr:adenosylcobinamide-GDP ribazoletransferase [Breznakibacter xylanolyticus]PZX13845.1 cobalamin-5'-phosphate synthase [Breznakibacter xylanolyticus]
MNMIRNQWALFATALMFFTRIPVSVPYSQELLNRCNRYFPLVGMLVGGIGAGVFWGASLILPSSVAVLLSMVATVLVTGAFHEDGFADVCDGFGGGWTKARVLEIMKDSRVGAYGVIGMFFLLGVKFVALREIPDKIIPATLIAGHTLSRLMAVMTMHGLEYVREDESSKSKPVTKNIQGGDLLIAIISALLVLFLFYSWWFALLPFVMLISKFFVDAWFKRRIGGYTGDCLGTVQQITEVVAYLAVLVILEFS